MVIFFSLLPFGDGFGQAALAMVLVVKGADVERLGGITALK